MTKFGRTSTRKKTGKVSGDPYKVLFLHSFLCLEKQLEEGRSACVCTVPAELSSANPLPSPSPPFSPRPPECPGQEFPVSHPVASTFPQLAGREHCWRTSRVGLRRRLKMRTDEECRGARRKERERARKAKKNHTRVHTPRAEEEEGKQQWCHVGWESQLEIRHTSLLLVCWRGEKAKKKQKKTMNRSTQQSKGNTGVGM